MYYLKITHNIVIQDIKTMCMHGKIMTIFLYEKNIIVKK